MSLGDDVLFLPVRELGERIRRHTLSPVELCESYLERARSLGPRLHAFAELVPEQALAQARAAEKDLAEGHWHGPLHGVPYAAKDLLAQSAAPTTWGAKIFERRKLSRDATVIRRLAAAGAVLFGQSGDDRAGRRHGLPLRRRVAHRRNEKSLEPGLLDLRQLERLGRDRRGRPGWLRHRQRDLGSIVCPSAFCGISGLRPTYGRVSRAGAMALAYSMDKIGPMARSAEDCALVLAAIAVTTAPTPRLCPTPRRLLHSQRLRPRRTWAGCRTPGSACRCRWRRPSAPPPRSCARPGAHRKRQASRRTLEAAASITIQVEGASAFAHLIESGRIGELHDPSGRLGGYVAEAISAVDYHLAQRARGVLLARMEGLFRRFDVLATLAVPAVATRLEENIEDALAFPDPLGAIGNLLGLPAVVVPCGLSPEKLPIGLVFVGAPLGDDKVLAAAQLFQRRTDWHRRRPPI